MNICKPVCRGKLDGYSLTVQFYSLTVYSLRIECNNNIGKININLRYSLVYGNS